MVALAAAVASIEPLRVSPYRQAQVLARVLEGRRPGQWLLRVLSRPVFALTVVLLLAGIATAATVAPRLELLRWGWPSAHKAPLTGGARVPAPVVPSWAEPPAAAPPPEVHPRVEASARRHDPQAERLAARYLRTYPNGRFRLVARQTLLGGQ